ncbi:hypothetical protein HPB51_029831 [Rhipicephalus microplus]|uniref:Uncharacterized protein n=1 Tax=Rhipicephalus microplus TaxID=6941 RepID=A0A9J6CTD5_RHIMP|nr:hypothetical protein HPB51_029831 [Rhipicephalus microplus]
MDAYAEELAFPTISSACLARSSSAFHAIRHGQQRDTAHPPAWSNAGARLVHGREGDAVQRCGKHIVSHQRTTGSITREQLESGGKKFLGGAGPRPRIHAGRFQIRPSTGRIAGVNSSQRSASGQAAAFLTMSASEVHWERLLETLERLRVGPTARLGPCPRDGLGARGS